MRYGLRLMCAVALAGAAACGPGKGRDGDFDFDETLFDDETPGSVENLFPNQPRTGSAESPTLLYPLDGAVTPSTLAPPTIQWQGGEEGDVYRVTAETGNGRITGYSTHTGTGYSLSFTLPSGPWAELKRNREGMPISFTVDRYSQARGRAYASETHIVEMVSANVTGAIYYWDLADGKLLRISEQGREDFMPYPPRRVIDGKRCVACHTVSRDGKFLAAELWDTTDYSAVFDLTANLAADPPPMVVQPNKYKALFSTFNPDASRLMINTTNGLSLIDLPTGNLVETAGEPLPNNAAHPTWSPDGGAVAFVTNHDGALPTNFTVSDLAIIDATDGDAFGAPRILLNSWGLANSWPSFSPDSQLIAFGRGTNSRGRNDALDQVFPGSLWIVDRDGGDAVQLDAANGGGDGGTNDSYLPNFSPFEEGGYFWLTFYSTRDYGNAQAGTKGTGRRQLWVTAINTDPAPGEDPSHIPYWLPGQDVQTQNMSGYWANEPPIN